MASKKKASAGTDYDAGKQKYTKDVEKEMNMTPVPMGEKYYRKKTTNSMKVPLLPPKPKKQPNRADAAMVIKAAIASRTKKRKK